MSGTQAVHTLLSLLSEVDFSAACGGGRLTQQTATGTSGEDELSEFSVGQRIKQQLVAARAERLARFLRLQLAAGGSLACTPRDASTTTPSSGVGGASGGFATAAAKAGKTSRHRLSHDDSADEIDFSPRCMPQWSPVSILDNCALRPDTPGSSTPGSSQPSGRSTEQSTLVGAAAAAAVTPVPCALGGLPQRALGSAKAPPPPPPMPPPPGILRMGVRVMPPSQLNLKSPRLTPVALAAPQQPAASTTACLQVASASAAAAAPPPPPPPPPPPAARPAGAAPPPPPPPPPPRQPGSGKAAPPPPPPPPPVAGKAPPAPPPPPPPRAAAGQPGLTRLAIPPPPPPPAGGAKGHTAPPVPQQPGAAPPHLAAPPPKEGFQRRPLHFDAVYARNFGGSLWEQPPPQQQQAAAVADPGAAIRVDALDRLFAKQLAGAAVEGSGDSSLQHPTAGAAAAATDTPHAVAADSDASGSSSPNRRLASRGSLTLAKRPTIRFFTGGRKAVNIEILLRKLGSPAEVALAIAELDTSRLQVAVLRELQANLPEQSELEALHGYLDSGGDASLLGKAEQLFVALRGTVRLQQKLQVLQFKGELHEHAAEVIEPLGRISAALDQLRSSTQLRLLLHTALRLGNTLNAGRKAPQRGMRLASLRKLGDTRSMDGRTTLMHYLVALMLEAEPEALLLGKPGSQCSAVPDAKHWTFAELDAQLASISTGIEMVRQEQAAASGGEKRQLAALAGQASCLVQRAQQLLSGATQKARDALKFLAEDVPGEAALVSTEPRRLLTDLSDFLALMHQAHGDGNRMAVCLATLRQQEESEEQHQEEQQESCKENEGQQQQQQGELKAEVAC